MNRFNALSSEQLKVRYGDFYPTQPNVVLDLGGVPESLHQLVPYAEIWGISDDWGREQLAKQAPRIALQDLVDVCASFEDLIDDWLAGPEVDRDPSTNEYVAFSAMRMEADFSVLRPTGASRTSVLQMASDEHSGKAPAHS